MCSSDLTRGPGALAHPERLFAHWQLGHWADVLTSAWHSGPPQRRFRTSGSTGRPRSISHPLAWLQQEAHAWLALLRPHGVQRVVAAVRAHHIYGHIFTLTLPALADLPVLDAAWQPVPLTLAQLQPGDLVVAHPDWWRALARCGHPLPPGVVGVTATAPCPAELHHDLLALGLATLLHIYGSTETAGMGWRFDADSPYTLLPAWQDACLDDHGQPPQTLSRLDADGQAAAIALPDTVQWLGPRQLLPIARVDHAVQVGGVNVQPQAVAQHLRSLPGVSDATVRLHDFAGGPRLKAYVVPAAGASAEALLPQLHLHAQRLPPAARPVHITLGEALPRNAAGKACDWPVEAHATP